MGSPDLATLLVKYLGGLGLPQAAYLFIGLSLQAMARVMLTGVAKAVLIGGVVFTLAQVAAGRGSLGRAVGYTFTSFVLLALFWPEALELAGQRTWITASQVTSFAAQRNQEVTGKKLITTARETGMVPPRLDPDGGIALPKGEGLLLVAFNNLILNLAQLVDPETSDFLGRPSQKGWHRTFTTAEALNMLWGMKLESGTLGAVRDFTQGCYLPAKTALLKKTPTSLSFEDLLPWGVGGRETPMQLELKNHYTTPGANTSLWGWLKSFFRSPVVNCSDMVGVVTGKITEDLDKRMTKAGTPLAKVFQAELGITPEGQAQFLFYRELLGAMGPKTPEPSLAGKYSILRIVRGVGSFVGGIITGFRERGIWGAITGGVAAGAEQIGNELGQLIDRFSTIIGWAMFFKYTGPYLLGLIQLVILALFPVFFLLALLPGNQFQAIVQWAQILFWSLSSSFWWALADRAGRLATLRPPLVISDPLGIIIAAQGWTLELLISSLGILMIPIIQLILMVGSARSLKGLWAPL